MAKYLLISSRDPFESMGTIDLFTLALSLKHAKDDVDLFFVQNGVFSATLGGASEPLLTNLAGAGIGLFADDFSLRERGISRERVVPSVRPSPLDVVLDALANGHKVLWH